MKTIYLLVGSIGSGKSAVCCDIFYQNSDYNVEYIGSDFYKKKFFDTIGDRLSEGYRKADKLVELKMEKACIEKRDFIYEICPTKQLKIDKVKFIKDKYLYSVVTFLIGTDDVTINIKRSKERTLKEGADVVSDEKVYKKYFETMDNIEQVTSMSDIVYFIDNTMTPKVIACLENKRLHIYNHVDWFDKYVLKLENKL